MGSFQWVPLRGGETRGERPRKLGPQERFFPRNPGGSQPCRCPPGGVDLPQDGGHQCGARHGSLGRGLALRRPVCPPQLVAHTPSARSFASPPWPFGHFTALFPPRLVSPASPEAGIPKRQTFQKSSQRRVASGVLARGRGRVPERGRGAVALGWAPLWAVSTPPHLAQVVHTGPCSPLAPALAPYRRL